MILACHYKYAFYFLVVGATIWASSWAGHSNSLRKIKLSSSGFVVGFTAVWQLALITLAVVPLIAVIGAIHTTTLAKLSVERQSQGENIVEHMMVQIRVVMAFVGESRALHVYSSALKVAQKLGYKTGFAKGMGLGATYFVVMLFSFGTKKFEREEMASNGAMEGTPLPIFCQLVEVSRRTNKRWFEPGGAAEKMVWERKTNGKMDKLAFYP
ncbi:hypothetical protein F3Y22_tig00110388pilonHSYRG00396 [Hibiscus syriacus]|uniref:ABC transmembrane type-1 domain-containing protein n=1 Tax=Hibiscus syriacus TaxID=106335 RepID=A0A6A3AVD4_HIBSY|nr:hypothetical protein F3Y22_tig00110388pilonHSYRG00396 [Hibiscus syriacus]